MELELTLREKLQMLLEESKQKGKVLQTVEVSIALGVVTLFEFIIQGG